MAIGRSHGPVHGEWIGEKDTALADARQAVEIAERNGAHYFIAVALGSLGDALRLERHHRDALEAYQKALDLIRTKRVGLQWRPHVVGGQALVYSALGEHRKAIAQAKAALEESVTGGNRRAEDFVLLALARALLATGDSGLLDEIEKTVERAETCCQETGMRVHRPCLLELRAAVAAHRGSPEEARRRLREAHSFFTQMGATGHAERLAKELGL